MEEGQICDDLDKQSGIKKGKKSVKVKRKKGDKYNNGHYGNPSSPSNDYIADYREDEGGGASRFYKHIEQNQPSRFLFCSKANKKEKQAGLEDFEEQPLVEARIGCHGNKDKNICPTCKAPLKDGQTCKFHPKSTGSRHYQSRYIKCGKKFNGSPDTLCKCPGKKEYDVSAYKLKNNHPTVQPIKLLEYLISLVSYPGTTILDCFNGSGSTGCASMNLNKDYNYIGIEMNKHYCDISEARIAHWLKQTEEREEPKDIFAGEKKITIK